MRFISPLSRRSFLAAIPLLLLCGPFESRASADWTPGEYVIQAMARVMGSVRIITDNTKYGYDSDGICLLGAYLREGKTVSFNRKMTKGTRYVIIGGGDDDVEDLDLEIYSPEGAILARDDSVSAEPVVEFTAPLTGTYTIQQKLFSARANSYCVVAILQDGGFDVPYRNLLTSTTRLIEMCQIVDSQVTEQVGFHDEPNMWAIYGTMLRQGENESITNISMGHGRRVMLATADENSEDIDLFALDEDQLVFMKDIEPDATPILDYYARGNPKHGFRISNVESDGASLVLVALLQIRE